MGRTRRGAAAASAALLLAACTGGGQDDTETVVVTTTTEPPAERVDDGVLRIGALVPQDDTAVGAALTQELEAAVDVLNEAGGALGSDVELVIRDEGATALTAAEAIELLVGADGVDAIIGPTSSNSAIGALDSAVDAGVVTCSATAASIALDDFPDDSLFFRSIATESLQAIAIANQAQATGARQVAVVNVDDAFSRPYAAATIEALGANSSIAVSNIAVPVDDDDLSDEFDLLAADGAPTLIVLGSGADVGRFLEGLGQRDDIGVRDIIVNDAARDAATGPVIAALPPEFRNRIIGIAPQIVLPDNSNAVGDDPNLAFGPQVTDCVTLVALAAVQSGSDAPQLIAGQMASVSSGGSVCQSFEECAAQIERELQINYDGPTGVTELGRNGDPSRARFDRFRFDVDGSAVFEREFTVER